MRSDATGGAADTFLSYFRMRMVAVVMHFLLRWKEKQYLCVATAKRKRAAH